MRFIARLIGNGVGLWLATLLVGGIHMTPTATTGQTVLAFAVVALVLTLVNAIVRPIVKLISLPLYLLTLGLFFLVVNALMLMLTGWQDLWDDPQAFLNLDDQGELHFPGFDGETTAC